MPTNREWLEHTEKAAWDTVQSLRRQIAEEREKVSRLAPIRESWQRMLATLDAAKVEHSLSAERYADLLDLLQAEHRRVKAERDALAQKVVEGERAVRDATQRVEVVRLGPPPPDERRGDGPEGSVHWFAERVTALLHEQAGAQRRSRPATHERLLAALEAKVEELEDVRGSEAVDLAAEVSALAFRIARLRGRRVPVDTDDPDDD